MADSIAYLRRTTTNEFTFIIDDVGSGAPVRVPLLPVVGGFVPVRKPRGYGDVVRINWETVGVAKVIYSDGTTSLSIRTGQDEWRFNSPLPPPPTLGAVVGFDLVGGRTRYVTIPYTGTGKLTWSVSRSKTGVATVKRSLNSLTIKANKATNKSASVVITVKISDKWGRSASRSFTVYRPRLPQIVTSFAPLYTLDTKKSRRVKMSVKKDSKATISVSGKSTSSTAKVKSVSATGFTLYGGEKAGTGKISITVRDSFGQTHSKSFNLTIKNDVKWFHPMGKKWYSTTYGGDAEHNAGARDFPTGSSTPPLYAACNGIVRIAGAHLSCNPLVVIIQADGEGTTAIAYYHLSKIDVKVGQRVSAGQKIGNVGTTGCSTGNHLHLSVWRDWRSWGSWYAAIPFFRSKGITLS